MSAADPTTTFPLPLEAYGPRSVDGLLATLIDRVHRDPFNAVATGIFVLAIVHSFSAARFTAMAHHRQQRADEEARAAGRVLRPSVQADLLHFFGEIEVVFGLWAIVLVGAITGMRGWSTATLYLGETVNYTEAMFVVVIMALASTRPIVAFAEFLLGKVARLGGATPAAWWLTILTIGPMLGSFITEPAAMTICALLLAQQFYDLQPTLRLKLATLGLLFVNVSIGGTLTHFAAPPVLMVARPWEWDMAFMLNHFGWRAAAAVVVSNLLYFVSFRRELLTLTAVAAPAPNADTGEGPSATESPADALLPVPRWVTVTHMAFMAWTVVTAHYPPLVIGGFLFFLGFVRATSSYQHPIELRAPLLVGFFLAGLVIHGGLQAWWIAPVLASLPEQPLFFGSTMLTAFNDNALIAYLATLVPDLSDPLKIAVVQGAVTGGGLTLIANAPNPAGHAVLSRYFGGAVPPLGLAIAALVPTLIACVMFRWL